MNGSKDNARLDSSAYEAARRLIHGRRSRPEDNIRQDLGRLLDAIEIENLINIFDARRTCRFVFAKAAYGN